VVTRENFIVKRLNTKAERDGTFFTILDDMDVKASEEEYSLYTSVGVGFLGVIIVLLRILNPEKVDLESTCSFFCFVF
jgi:hypothetical protein